MATPKCKRTRRQQLPNYLVGMNPDYVFSLLDQVAEPLKAVILEDFRRVNDICRREMDLPVKAAQRFGVPVGSEERLEMVAMRLFLDHATAFDHAWALYSYRASWANISQHWLQRANPKIDQGQAAELTENLEAFFRGQARGDECQVSFHDEGQSLVLLVLHGSHLRTLACWQGHDIAVNCFRPACEDVLIYDKERAVLSVKASTETDREHYIRCFARIVLRDIDAADHPQRDLVYTLDPLQNERFAWAGKGRIASVELMEAKMRLPEPGGMVLQIAGGKLGTAAQHLSGVLLGAKLRFSFDEGGRSDCVTFSIMPPCITDLVKKRNADLISDYLREKGVLLR